MPLYNNDQYRPSDHLAGSRNHHYGQLQPMEYPKPRWAKRIAGWVVIIGLAALLVLAFDHMMRVDKAHLCASDTTAYKGCERHG